MPYPRSHRLRCEDLNRIDFARLQREGFLTLGVRHRLTWPNGSTISLTFEGHCITLAYRTRESDGGWGDVSQHIWIASTPTNFGGTRQWFECPRCRRTCRILFAAHRFQCRTCLDLAYTSQTETRQWRLLGRAQRIRRRLGGTGSLYDSFPRKPRTMHWRTYRALEARCVQAETLAFTAISAGLAGRAQR